jgi:ATP-dependent DNA helicase RecQ
MPKRKLSDADILRTAKSEFNFDELRPGQLEAIRSLLQGRDTLVVQPTGSGKSAIYQIAGLLIQGLTLVISPLIALQKDQVDSINEQSEAGAVVVNSHQKALENRQTLEQIGKGAVEYVFLAPEQLRKDETLDRLQAGGVSLIVVDEAHCISQWGHDFRPNYMDIGAAIERLGHPVVLALTATASGEVREEIVQRLGMREPKVLVHGFDRPNIYLRVDHFSSEKDKLDALIHRVRWADKPGIIYVATRKKAEEIMAALEEQEVSALFYHGGLKPAERESIQERFMSGDAEVIVATNAFGMGVDKADVRFVYHFDISDSLDSYYQEIGRAGRDGEKAEAVLFYRSENLGVQKFRTGSGALQPAEVEQVARIIAKEDEPVSALKIAEETEISSRKISTVLHRLEDAGAVEVLPTGEVQMAESVEIGEAAQAASGRQDELKERNREKLRHMQEYADASTCRRKMILEYFGDECADVCNNCDNCEGAGSSETAAGGGTRREVA